MQNEESKKIVDRFFEAIYDLKSKRVIRGKRTFCKKYNINARNFWLLEQDKSRDVLQLAWLSYLIADYGISAEWLMTGVGSMYAKEHQMCQNKKQKMNIKRICQFLLDKEPGKPDAKLRYRIKWDNNKNIVAFNVGYRVDIDKWSTDTQRCKNNTTSSKLKIEEKKIIFSEWDEQMTVYNYKIPEELQKLDTITTIKTADALKIELNNYSKSILLKCNNSKFPDNLALSVISNQNMLRDVHLYAPRISSFPFAYTQKKITS